ncbi:hypothetical protein PENTCL1PPCAC_19204, partial [Pristionchus entomophagus]
GGETEKKVLALIEQDLIKVKEELVVRLRSNIFDSMVNLKDSRENGNESAGIEKMRASIVTLLRATNDFEQKKDLTTLEEFEEEVRKVVKQLVETLAVFGCPKREMGDLLTKFVTKRIDTIKFRYALYAQKAELERLTKDLDEKLVEDPTKEIQRLMNRQKEMEKTHKKEIVRLAKYMDKDQKEEIEKNARYFSYRLPPQDRLTCDCHSRMGQIFATLGPGRSSD